MFKVLHDLAPVRLSSSIHKSLVTAALDSAACLFSYHCLVMCSQYGPFNAACIGGSLSDWACFFRNSNHLISFTLEMYVFGCYNWQINFSIAAMILDVGCTVVPRFASAVTLSSSALRNAFQHPSFPLHAKLPVVSAPLQA